MYSCGFLITTPVGFFFAISTIKVFQIITLLMKFLKNASSGKREIRNWFSLSSSGFPTSRKRYILGREQCSTMEHYDIFLDINQQLSNGTLQYFLEQAKCKPQNCKQNFWDYQKIFEEPYLEDESGALGYSSVMEQQKYTLVFYMKTPEVKFFKTSL